MCPGSPTPAGPGLTCPGSPTPAGSGVTCPRSFTLAKPGLTGPMFPVQVECGVISQDPDSGQVQTNESRSHTPPGRRADLPRVPLWLRLGDLP